MHNDIAYKKDEIEHEVRNFHRTPSIAKARRYTTKRHTGISKQRHDHREQMRRCLSVEVVVFLGCIVHLFRRMNSRMNTWEDKIHSMTCNGFQFKDTIKSVPFSKQTYL